MRFLLPVLIVFLSGCTLLTEHRSGLVDGDLQPCPQAPRCVSSQAQNERHAIAPLSLAKAPEEAWPVVKQLLQAMPRTSIVDERENYLRAEIVSPWHVYTDDLELLIQPPQKLIDVRSTGRIGYYDFNVNRDRVEALRAALIKAGVVKPEPAEGPGN
ncbi:MAG: DUF1499 domain-containing protein [Salinisphaeraceae bacterium]|nr:DUF1499 domain-containing protein [Salinisphaeraceae bacterium]